MFATIYNETMPTMTDALFVPELDGQTFASMDDLYDWQAAAAGDYGPVWSNYGGWVA